MAGEGEWCLYENIPDPASPFIVRSVGSHGGVGLEKIEHRGQHRGLSGPAAGSRTLFRPMWIISGEDGLFRKYRVALIGGRPFAEFIWRSRRMESLGISAPIWRSTSSTAWKRPAGCSSSTRILPRVGPALLAAFFALTELDYVVIDCAETRDGNLLIFEADNGAIVHDMDPPSIFPYKSAHMQKLFKAFLCRNALPSRHPKSTMRSLADKEAPQSSEKTFLWTRRTGCKRANMPIVMLDDILDSVQDIRQRPVWQ